jgi:hypothetical protein
MFITELLINIFKNINYDGIFIYACGENAEGLNVVDFLLSKNISQNTINIQFQDAIKNKKYNLFYKLLPFKI